MRGVFNLPAKVSTLIAGLLDYFRQALLQGCRAAWPRGYTPHGCMPRHDLTGEQGSDLMHLRLNICCSCGGCNGCLLRRAAALINDLLEPELHKHIHRSTSRPAPKKVPKKNYEIFFIARGTKHYAQLKSN
jgi:hypothetical protein